MNLAHQEDEKVIDEDYLDQAVKVDLLRRAGAFDRASAICEGILQHTRYTGVGPNLVFQLELCKKLDTERHTLDEVPGRSRK